jgi:hypothetical protein
MCVAYITTLKNVVTYLLKAFLGNNSVNTFQRATMEDVYQCWLLGNSQHSNELVG